MAALFFLFLENANWQLLNCWTMLNCYKCQQLGSNNSAWFEVSDALKGKAEHPMWLRPPIFSAPKERCSTRHPSNFLNIVLAMLQDPQKSQAAESRRCVALPAHCHTLSKWSAGRIYSQAVSSLEDDIQSNIFNIRHRTRIVVDSLSSRRVLLEIQEGLQACDAYLLILLQQMLSWRGSDWQWLAV